MKSKRRSMITAETRRREGEGGGAGGAGGAGGVFPDQISLMPAGVGGGMFDEILPLGGWVVKINLGVGVVKIQNLDLRAGVVSGMKYRYK
eukprot:571985-Hanusia_phi.AAC.1